MKRIVGYARVSSREQADNSHALEQQIKRLQAADAINVITDVESGSKANRPGLKKLLDIVKDGQVDEVVITRLDRLARSIVTTKRAIDLFIKHEVNLRALDDAIDLSTSAGRFHVNMISVWAEMEADLLSERVQHGWADLRKRKVAVNPPFGYIKVDNGFQLDHRPFLSLIESQKTLSRAEIARWCIEAFFEAKSLRGAIRLINEHYGIRTFANPTGTRGRTSRGIFRWSATGYRTWLTSPTLCGHTCYLRKKKGKRQDRKDWEIHYNTHPAHRLMTDGEVEDVEKILSLNKKHRGYGAESKPKYPLSGLVYCAECRRAMYALSGGRGKNQPGRNYYYQCSRWRSRDCDNKKVIRMEKCEAAVIDALCQSAETVAEIALEPLERELSPKERELTNQLVELDRIPGQNPAIERAREEIKQQLEYLNIEATRAKTALGLSRKQLIGIGSNQEYWHSLKREEKRELFQLFVDKIKVKDGIITELKLKV